MLRPSFQIAKGLQEWADRVHALGIAFAFDRQHPDVSHATGLLRASDERPPRRRTAYQRDELSPSHPTTSSTLSK
jgi:hypothetical protein